MTTPRNLEPTRRFLMSPNRASRLPEHRRGSQWSKSCIAITHRPRRVSQLVSRIHKLIYESTYTPTLRRERLSAASDGHHSDLRHRTVNREKGKKACRWRSPVGRARLPLPRNRVRVLVGRSGCVGPCLDDFLRDLSCLEYRTNLSLSFPSKETPDLETV